MIFRIIYKPNKKSFRFPEETEREFSISMLRERLWEETIQTR